MPLSHLRRTGERRGFYPLLCRPFAGTLSHHNDVPCAFEFQVYLLLLKRADDFFSREAAFELIYIVLIELKENRFGR